AARDGHATEAPEPRFLASRGLLIDRTMPDAQQETIDYVALQRLQSLYADVVNRRAWPELGELFLPDAPVRVDTVTSPAIDLTGPTGVGDFIGGAIERFEFFEFAILNLRIDLYPDGRADEARGRLFMCELRQERDNGRFSRAFGVYHDDFRKV